MYIYIYMCIYVLSFRGNHLSNTNDLSNACVLQMW